MTYFLVTIVFIGFLFSGCEDKHKKCGKWAKTGRCKEEEIKEKCQKSCNNCGGGGGGRFPFKCNLTFHIQFKEEKLKQNKKSTLNTFMCLLDLTNKASLKNIKMKRQKKPERPLTLGRSETQYVAMVT